jgi:hypothetical protein
MTVRGLVLLWLCILLAGCTQLGSAQPNCNEMIALQGQISREASPEQLKAWIAETYRISPDSITSDLVPQTQGHLLQWRTRDLWYRMSIARGVVTDIGVDARGLTAADVIACLGQPTQYSATYGMETEGGKQLDFDLLFPKSGILAGGVRILKARPEKPPAITAEFPMLGVRFMQPGPVPELVQRLASEYVPALREQMIKGYKPWPGDWQAVQITPFVSPP